MPRSQSWRRWVSLGELNFHKPRTPCPTMTRLLVWKPLGLLLCLAGGFGPLSGLTDAAEKPLKVLFLGDNGHHQPAVRASILAPVMERRGITIDYTQDASVL